MSFHIGGSSQPAYIPPAAPPPPNPATFANGDVQDAGQQRMKQLAGFGSTIATSPSGAGAAPTGGKTLTGQ